MTPLKQKILSWILPLTVILGLLFALQQWQEKRRGEIDFPDLPPALTPHFPPPPDSEAMEKILEEQQKLAALSRDQKTFATALKQGDLQLCEKISRSELREECEDSLRYSKLLQQSNPTACQSLHALALEQQCLDTLMLKRAVEKSNPKQCEGIEDEGLKKHCLTQVQVGQLQTQNNPEACETLENETQKVFCLDQMQLKNAVRQNNPRLCREIENSTLETQCLSILENNQAQLARSKQNLSLEASFINELDGLKKCEPLPARAQQKCEDEFYFNLAFLEKNLASCDKILNQEEQIRCRKEQQAALDQYFLKRALALKSETDCQKIKNDALKVACLDQLN